MSAMVRLSPQALDAMRRARRRFARAQHIRTADWAVRNRKLASGQMTGNFSFDGQPAIEGLLDAYDDPTVRELWAQKSSQFGYTQGVELNIIGRHMHVHPLDMLIVFPKGDDAQAWMKGKLEPCIRATPALRVRIDLDRRGPDNTLERKAWAGGSLELVASNSPGNLKSRDVPVVVVSEPDDTSTRVGGAARSQGDAITLGRERVKSFTHGKLVVGGTPTISGLSPMEAGMERSDKRRFFVECPHCGHSQHLRWEQVRWDKNASIVHPVFGTAQPQTARYYCEACEDPWTDTRKNQLIRAAAKRADKGWRATAPFFGIAGFYINELMSVMDGSRMEILVIKWLEAVHDMKLGNDAKMRAFRNNQMGECWMTKSSMPEVEALKERSKLLAYPEWTVPHGGVVVLGFVDVQRGSADDPDKPPRLEVMLRAFGRDTESWLIHFGAVHGNPLERSTWDALDAHLASHSIRHASGALLGITSIGVDAGDGMTMDAVIEYCRRKQALGLDVYPTKGDGKKTAMLYRPAKPLDHTSTDKPSRWGIKLYMIGANTAKDDLAGRLKLSGSGPRRMHVHADIRGDYWEHLQAEAVHPGTGLWTKRPGIKGNEGLDCEVGLLHAAHRRGLHNMTEAEWQRLSLRVAQPDLLHTPAENAAPVRMPPATPLREPAPSSRPPAGGIPGFGRRGLM